MGKYQKKQTKKKLGSAPQPQKKTFRPGRLWVVCGIVLSFFLVEYFAFSFLGMERENGSALTYWPLAFGGLWAVICTGIVCIFPGKVGRFVYAGLYFLFLIYAGVQTGYFQMFSEMMWISEFLYGAEGSDYFSVLLNYPLRWWLGLIGLAVLGGLLIWRFPKWPFRRWRGLAASATALIALVCALNLPEAVFVHDSEIRYAGSDYGRMQSAEAAYDNMFNTHRLYQVCGLYQTAVKDVYANTIYPLTPGYALERAKGKEQIDAYFAQREGSGDNTMTGLLEGKNVVLVLMESMDDWMIGEHTPTISRLMAEGINFTNFYTPVYGGIRTFNTEFCINTGSFLSSAGGYAFDYVTNTYDQSFAGVLEREGYSAKVFHYNDPSFYSRGVYSLAMGYEEYVCYADYVDPEAQKDRLYDDTLLFDEAGIAAEFFREEDLRLNFIITRSAHLSYKYNEVLSYWGLKQYPQYRGLTGNEETDCAYLKARLVDDLFSSLLVELEARGELENTVIIGVTDHYTYGYKDMESLYALSGVTEELLLEKTPCFIWAADLEAMEVDKTLNTSDLLPTVLNLMGVDAEHSYMGRDAFDEDYAGFVPFSDGSWISGGVAYNAGTGEILCLTQSAQVTEEFLAEMSQQVGQFIEINNLILETDYYK